MGLLVRGGVFREGWDFLVRVESLIWSGSFSQGCGLYSGAWCLVRGVVCSQGHVYTQSGVCGYHSGSNMFGFHNACVHKFVSIFSLLFQ